MLQKYIILLSADGNKFQFSLMQKPNLSFFFPFKEHQHTNSNGSRKKIDLRSLQVNVGGTHDACLPIGNKKKCTDVKTIITVGTGAYIPYISLSAVKVRKYFLALAVYDPLKVSKVANCEDTVVLVVTKTKHMRDFDNRVLFFIYIIFILHMDYF